MLSLPHLIVLFVVALVIFGPQKLPELARMLGKATADFRKMTSDFRFALENEVRELERETRIREEEVAAATRASQLPPTNPPAPPEFTTPRESPATEAAVQTEAERTSQTKAEIPSQTEAERTSDADPGPEQPAPPETVSVPQEKPSDDNTAV